MPRNREEWDKRIRARVDAAVDFTNQISAERAGAIKAYFGEPYGDEEEGRSQFVSRDVHDTVEGQMPDLLRILLGAERPVEFEARTVQDAQWVGAATEYVDAVVRGQNEGFHQVAQAIKDALIEKEGFLKYWWDDAERVQTSRYSGLTPQDALAVLASDDATLKLVELDGEAASEEDLTVLAQVQAEQEALAQQTGQPPLPLPEVTVDVQWRRREGRVRIEALPPEDLIVDADAADLDKFTLIGHRTRMTRSQLRAMGFDAGEIEDAVDYGRDPDTPEDDARDRFRGIGKPAPLDEGVLYVEAYTYADYDDDGVDELRRIVMLGDGLKVVENEPAAHHPFAKLSVSPVPHKFFGESTADKVADVQKIKTHVLRNTMDSLAQSIHARMGVVEGQVNMDDVLNNEVGSVVRMRAPGMVQPFTTPFAGQQAMPVIDYLDTTREMRTGVSRQSLGLSNDALQSTTRLAVEQSVSGAQGKIELIARHMAYGLTRLYAGVLRLLVENQQTAVWAAINGEPIRIDPTEWHVEVGVRVNVALGAGTIAQRMTSLSAILQRQEMIIQEQGLNQPIVSPRQYANALRRWAELAGWRNPDEFFSLPPEDWRPQPPGPDPQMELAEKQMQLQAQVAQMQAENEKLKMQLQAQKAEMDDARERDKNVADVIIRSRELELKYQSAREDRAIRTAAGLEQADMKRRTAVEQAQINAGANAVRQARQHEHDDHAAALKHTVDVAQGLLKAQGKAHGRD